MFNSIKRIASSFLDVFRVCLIILAFIVILGIILKAFNVDVAIVHTSASRICKTMVNFFNWLSTLV